MAEYLWVTEDTTSPVKDASFDIVLPWGRYPVRIWKPKNPEHGDLTTDVAFVICKIYKDAAKIAEGAK
jgi:arginyl-tRNA synthetase